MNRLSPENVLSVSVVKPSTTNGGLDNTPYLNMRNAEAIRFDVVMDQAVADATVISIYQDKEKGTGSADEKPLVMPVPIWANEAVTYGLGTGSLAVRVADGVSHTVTATISAKHIIFYVRQSKLDLANGFTHVTLKVSDSTQATNMIAINASFETQFQGETIEPVYFAE